VAGRAAKRQQDQRRRDRILANGPVERFTVAEIGERDDWLCGICRDPDHPVKRSLSADATKAHQPVPLEELVAEVVPMGEVADLRRDPLSASIDHVVAVAAGGTHTRGNVQIAHLFCNLDKNDASAGPPEYARARLASLIDGTPVPEELHRNCYPSWAYPARWSVELMIALHIAAGKLVADPRYGEPASRLDRFVRELGEDRWQGAVADMRDRHAKWRARWKPVQ
jgi:hypothetical protein